jgi:hypothetical protein
MSAPTVPPPLPTQPSAESPAASLGKRPCPECAGELEWNAGKRALACPYCGTVVPWSQAEADTAIREHDLATALAGTPAERRDWGDARREVKCESCQAISVFVGNTVAQRCDFCGSPSIVPHEALRDAIAPESLLPFQFDEGRIREALRKWYGSRWFAPNRLKSAALTDTLHGVYLPYWTFDARVQASWTADAGHYYYTTESYTDSKGQRRTRQQRHTRWMPAAGELAHFFDDTLVSGTVGVHAALIAKIEPFPVQSGLKPYAPEFVRGWTVERYQVDLRRASEFNMQQLEAQTRALCAAQVPGDTHRNLIVDAHYSGRTFKHILVPVWLVHYTYGSKTFQVVANGYTGTIAGERPYSWIKIALAAVGALLMLTLTLMLLGVLSQSQQ